ncbi:MAG: nucleoside monophosphate kinase [Candidatus Saccharimonadales bacterium]
MTEILVQPTDEQTLLINEIGEWLGTGTINAFGPQFAGKDANLRSLAPELDAHVLGGGEILRADDLPEEVAAAMQRGELIDSATYQQIVVPRLSAPELAGKPLLLSAVGRKLGEEQDVLTATDAAGHPTMAVVKFNITHEEAFRRLAGSPDRGRKDDNPESLRKRLEEYETDTVEVLDVYRRKSTFLLK